MNGKQQLIATICLGLALIGASLGALWPQHAVQVAPGSSLIMMFDVSQSMNTADLRIGQTQVSRLEMARRAANHAIDNLPCATAVGYGIFAAHRALLLAEPVEVCKHRVELKHALTFVSSTMAWHGNSEVAKGYYESLEIGAALNPRAAVVFFSDGHEAPPLNRSLRPRFDGEVGVVKALIAGMGGTRLVPIPKSDPTGRALGFWGADDVLQVDRFAANKISGESNASYVMPQTTAGVDPRVAGTPGKEHLSSVRQGYLQLLAEETDGVYARIAAPHELRPTLENILVMPGFTAFDVRRLAGLVALGLVLAFYLLRVGGLRTLWPPWKRSVNKLASNPS